MSLLSPADQEKLRESFGEMTASVRVLFFTQTLDCEPCVQTRTILDELPPLSDKIAVEEVNFILDKNKAAQYGIDRVPALALLTHDPSGNPRDTASMIAIGHRDEFEPAERYQPLTKLVNVGPGFER